jgi:hypothetical protein
MISTVSTTFDPLLSLLRNLCEASHIQTKLDKLHFKLLPTSTHPEKGNLGTQHGLAKSKTGWIGNKLDKLM